MAAATPAAAVQNATLPNEQRLFGTVATIAAQVTAGGGDGPTMVLIGEVVGMARRDALDDTALHEAA
jgi:siroheme synthase